MKRMKKIHEIKMSELLDLVVVEGVSFPGF
jgi:hypothetical protein